MSPLRHLQTLGKIIRRMFRRKDICIAVGTVCPHCHSVTYCAPPEKCRRCGQDLSRVK